MEQFHALAKKHFFTSLSFFTLGLLFGLYYSINLLGYALDAPLLDPPNVRAVHISLMLYGFIPLMLSYLPFFLLAQDLGYDTKAMRYVQLYTIVWYFFLLCMVVSLLMGVRRGLAFYDFHYSLNFILAFAGLFYLLGFYRYTRLYDVKPPWVKTTFLAILIAPVALLILMHPVIGKVEATIQGPHGDNTLGMSLALIPLYYLIIKYLSKGRFQARWNILWIIPAMFYALSVLHRSFVSALTYNEEWFFQWLTLLYVPLLYRWYKDAPIRSRAKKYLLISLLAFLFVDIEGNILFIPSIRWLFHRNDLVIAHAHVAIGIALFFMVASLYYDIIAPLRSKLFVRLYLTGLLGIFTVLSISGFVEAGFLHFSIDRLWLARSLFGLLVVISLLSFVKKRDSWSPLAWYNCIGFISDGIGAVTLFLLGALLYPRLGLSFEGNYMYVVFAFMGATGVAHLMALRLSQHQEILTRFTAIARSIVAAVFLSLFLSQRLGIEALGIGLFDALYAMIYFVLFYAKELRYV